MDPHRPAAGNMQSNMPILQTLLHGELNITRSAPAVAKHVNEQRPSQAKVIFSAPIANDVNEQQTPGRVSSLFLENKTTTKMKDECHQEKPLTLKVKPIGGGTLRQKAIDCRKIIKLVIYPKKFTSKQVLPSQIQAHFASLNPHIHQNSGQETKFSNISHAPTAPSGVISNMSTFHSDQNKNNYFIIKGQNDHTYSSDILREERFKRISEELPNFKEYTGSTNASQERQHELSSSAMLGQDRFTSISVSPKPDLETGDQKIPMLEEEHFNHARHQSERTSDQVSELDAEDKCCNQIEDELPSKVHMSANNGQETMQSSLDFKCKICGIKYENISEYFDHLSVHSNNSTLSVKNQSVSQPDENKSIIPIEEGCLSVFRFKCSVCDKSFSNQFKLKTHKAIHNEFLRQHCPKTVKTRPALLKHSHIHADRFKCNVCDKTLSSSSQLKCHMASHSDERPFSCPNCKKTFKIKYQLKHHMKIHTDPDRFRCSVCYKTFGFSGHLKDHMTTHSDVRPFKCTFCQKTFKLKRQLNSHMIIHTDPDRFRCFICDKSFDSRSRLKGHLIYHSEECPFSCQYCEKKYRLKRELAAHIIIHTHPDRFRCTVCNKAFSHSYKLKAHMVTHSQEHRFQCQKCKKSFKRNRALLTHMKICEGIIRAGYHNGEMIRLKSEEIRKASPNKSKIQSKGVRLGNVTCNKYQILKVFSHNSFSQCLMCLLWFKGFELEKHMFRCQVKRPCLNRIVEVKIEVKEEIQTDIGQEIKTEFLQEIKTDFDEGTKPEINHAIKTEIKVEPTIF